MHEYGTRLQTNTLHFAAFVCMSVHCLVFVAHEAPYVRQRQHLPIKTD